MIKRIFKLSNKKYAEEVFEYSAVEPSYFDLNRYTGSAVFPTPLMVASSPQRGWCSKGPLLV